MNLSNFLDGLKTDVKRLGNSTITIGLQQEPGKNIHGDTVSADDTTMKYGYVHEYGYDIKVTKDMRKFFIAVGSPLKGDTEIIHIPERSYIRRGKMEAGKSLERVMDEAIYRFLKGEMTVTEALDMVGLEAVTEIVANMGTDVPPISDFSREQRKESKTGAPLHDTGNLANHISFSVKEGE